MEAKTYMSIYLPQHLHERIRKAAAEDGRSVSNYLTGVLDRAHPAVVHPLRQLDIEEQIARTKPARKKPAKRK